MPPLQTSARVLIECAAQVRQRTLPWRGIPWHHLWDAFRFAIVAMNRIRFGYTPSQWRARAAFVWGWTRRLPLLTFILFDPSKSSMRLAVQGRPEMIGIAVWPYIHAGWDADQRLGALAAHYRQVDQLPLLALTPDESVEVAALDDVHPGLRLVLDRAPWFMREGELVLNLFVAEQRIFSAAFSLGQSHGRDVVLLGCLQGIRDPQVLELYRDLTKALHGMRPRDFIFAALRILSGAIGIERVFAIADSNRQHRSTYFGKSKTEQLDGNYDDVWIEQGGVLSQSGFFEFDSLVGRRSLEDTPAKKRAMYRRRYEFLDQLETRIALRLEHRQLMLMNQGQSEQ